MFKSTWNVCIPRERNIQATLHLSNQFYWVFSAQNFFKQVVVKVIYLYSLKLNKVSVGKVEIPSYQHL